MATPPVLQEPLFLLLLAISQAERQILILILQILICKSDVGLLSKLPCDDKRSEYQFSIISRSKNGSKHYL